MLEDTGERYLPWMKDAVIGYEHLHRYAYATQFVEKKRVLDLACGEGYGSYLLARTAESVVGIDIDENSIKHARNKYIKHNLEFKVGSITEVPIGGTHLFDVVVCFEALEHVENHQKLLSEVKRLLTLDGVFIVSTPNKTVYTDEPQYNNPFHVHELYFDEFRPLLANCFKQVKFLGQRIYCNSNMWPIFIEQNIHISEFVVERTPREFIFVESDRRVPMYFVAIASDVAEDISVGDVSILIDSTNELLRQKDVAIDNLISARDNLQATVTNQQQVLGDKDNQLTQVITERDRLAAEVPQLRTERDRLAGEVPQLQAVVQSHQRNLGEKERRLAQLSTERDRLAGEVSNLQLMVRSHEDTISEKQREIDRVLHDKERGRLKMESQGAELEATVLMQRQMLHAIEDSLAWALVLKYRRVRDILWPPRTRRRRIYDILKDSFKAPIIGRSAKLLNETSGPTESLGIKPDVEQSGSTPMRQAFSSSVLVTRSSSNSSIDAKLTVVIPTKDGISEDFESTLQAIQGQKGIPNVEIIVVDSGSTDGTVKVAEDYGAKVYPIPPMEFNHGLTRNFGAEQGTGEFILFMVQDAIPATDDLFYEMAKALRADPNLAGVTVRQVPKSNADIYACWEMWNHYRAFFEAPRPKLASLADIDRLPTQQLRRLAGLDDVCAMVRRQVWEKIRFKPTPFAEDLEFGLSCVRQGYNIDLLSHRGVIHSHTRSVFYGMARHYIDILVLLKLFKEPSQPKWVGTLSLGQLLSFIHRLYLGINEFAIRTEEYSTLDPARALGDLLSFVSKRSSTNRGISNLAGDARLDEFFGALERIFEDSPPTIDACELAFQGTINSILQFMGNRYSALARGDMIALMHKAFAGATGSVMGEYCFWHRHNGTNASQLEMLDDLLRKGAPV